MRLAFAMTSSGKLAIQNALSKIHIIARIVLKPNYFCLKSDISIRTRRQTSFIDEAECMNYEL